MSTIDEFQAPLPVAKVTSGSVKLPNNAAIVFVLMGDSYASGIAPGSTFASIYELPDGTPTSDPANDLPALNAWIGNKWTQASPNLATAAGGNDLDDWTPLDHTMGAGASGTNIGPEWGIAYTLQQRYAGARADGTTPEIYCIKQAVTSGSLDPSLVSPTFRLVAFHPNFNSGTIPAGGGQGQYDCLVTDQLVEGINGLIDGSIVPSGSDPRIPYFEGVYTCGPNGDASGAGAANAETAWPGNFLILLDSIRQRLGINTLNTVLSLSPLIGTPQTKNDGTYDVPAGTELLRRLQIAMVDNAMALDGVPSVARNRHRITSVDPSFVPRGTDLTHPTGQGTLWLGMAMGAAMEHGRTALHPITSAIS